jgi:hypothetical protein
MGHGPCTFREADLARALKAAKKAGVRVRVEIESGNKLAVTMLGEETPENKANEGNELEQWIEKHARKD